MGLVDHQGPAVKDGVMNRLILGDLSVVPQEHLAGVGLGVNIDQEHAFALWANPAASETLVEVLPVPPFWLATEITIRVSTYSKPEVGYSRKFLHFID